MSKKYYFMLQTVLILKTTNLNNLYIHIHAYTYVYVHKCKYYNNAFYCYNYDNLKSSSSY